MAAFLKRLQADGHIDTDQDFTRLAGLLERVNGMQLNRSEFFASIRIWAPRLSLLLLPFMVIALTIIHFWIRRIFVFDHVIVAMHFQTFLYFAATLAILLAFVSPGWAWSLFGVSVPVYLFFLLRHSYDTSHILNFGRVLGIIISTFVALILLIVFVSVISANEVGLFTWAELRQELSN